jgi:hypothetical protein
MTVVRVRTDAGIDGIGQAESPSLVMDAVIRTHGGLENLLEMAYHATLLGARLEHRGSLGGASLALAGHA